MRKPKSIICCFLEADRKAGSPFLLAMVEKITGIPVASGLGVKYIDRTPRRLITAKRVK